MLKFKEKRLLQSVRVVRVTEKHKSWKYCQKNSILLERTDINFAIVIITLIQIITPLRIGVIQSKSKKIFSEKVPPALSRAAIF